MQILSEKIARDPAFEDTLEVRWRLDELAAVITLGNVGTDW